MNPRPENGALSMRDSQGLSSSEGALTLGRVKKPNSNTIHGHNQFLQVEPYYQGTLSKTIA